MYVAGIALPNSGLLCLATWQQCEVGRTCVGSHRAERRKQVAALSPGECAVLCWLVVCFVGVITVIN